MGAAFALFFSAFFLVALVTVIIMAVLLLVGLILFIVGLVRSYRCHRKGKRGGTPLIITGGVLIGLGMVPVALYTGAVWASALLGEDEPAGAAQYAWQSSEAAPTEQRAETAADKYGFMPAEQQGAACGQALWLPQEEAL